MAILEADQHVKVIRASIPLRDFPTLLQAHLDGEPTTSEIEQLGANYVAGGFRSEDTENFVRAVCRWGNYPGVAGKVLKHNDLKFIRDQLQKAHAKIAASDPGAAIQSVTSIKCLAVSFGSKHLKFLCPDGAVVLDKIISERLGYLRTPEGYVEFLNDCCAIRDVLNEAKIAASKQRPEWRVCDVEMAIFIKLRK